MGQSPAAPLQRGLLVDILEDYSSKYSQVVLGGARTLSILAGLVVVVAIGPRGRRDVQVLSPHRAARGIVGGGAAHG